MPATSKTFSTSVKRTIKQCVLGIFASSAAVSAFADSLVDIESYPEPGASRPMPTFKVDAAWPTLPDTWLIGQVPGLAVDKQDNVWLLHRPNSLSGLDLALEQSPKTGLCCEAAPHVLQLSASHSDRLSRRLCAVVDSARRSRQARDECNQASRALPAEHAARQGHRALAWSQELAAYAGIRERAARQRRPRRQFQGRPAQYLEATGLRWHHGRRRVQCARGGRRR